MIRTCAFCLVAALPAACLKPNPDFVEGGSGGSGSGGTSGCVDAGGLQDPDAEGDARDLGSAIAPDPARDATGVLAAAQPQWWFYFASQSDGSSGHIVASLEADEPLEVCIFAECRDMPGVPVLLCSDIADGAKSELGRSGCCHTDAVSLLHACSGDVAVWLRVTDPEPAACVPFRVEYRVTELGG